VLYSFWLFINIFNTFFVAETTAMNPQFHIQIPRSSASATAKCHVVVSVTQQYETNPGKLLSGLDGRSSTCKCLLLEFVSI